MADLSIFHTYVNVYWRVVVEGSLEAQLPTMWTDEGHSQEEAEPRRNSEVEKVRRENIRDGESQKREDAGAKKVGKS